MRGPMIGSACPPSSCDAHDGGHDATGPRRRCLARGCARRSANASTANCSSSGLTGAAVAGLDQPPLLAKTGKSTPPLQTMRLYAHIIVHRREGGKSRSSTNHERNQTMTNSQDAVLPAFTEHRVQHADVARMVACGRTAMRVPGKQQWRDGGEGIGPPFELPPCRGPARCFVLPNEDHGS
jgi:hypothetical protein